MHAEETNNNVAALSPASEKVYAVLRQYGYQPGKTIGRGSFSKVKRAYSTKHGTHVALKQIDKRQANQEYVTRFLPRELDIILKLKHPNIVQVHQIFQSSKIVCIVEELAEGGDLLERIVTHGVLNETDAATVFAQINAALSYLHDRQLAHRDLKCENIFLNGRPKAVTVAKVGDFGFARTMTKDDLSATYCGSKSYAAPEIIRGRPYSGTAMDVWSNGVILYVTLTGHIPFDDRHPKMQLREQMERRLYYPPGTSLETRKVLYTTLDPDQNSRPTCHHIATWKWVRAGLQRADTAATTGVVSTNTPAPLAVHTEVETVRMPPETVAQSHQQ